MHFALVRLDFREAAVTNIELPIKRAVPDRNVQNSTEISVAGTVLSIGE